jgi:hypothetical protein
MKKQLRHALLIEVVIALGLTIMILMTLMFFYRQVIQIGAESDQIITKNFALRYIETRLAAILPRTVSQTDSEKDFVFFSIGDESLTKPGSQSLIFTFDNDISLDKRFSGHVLARLYLDHSGNLMIAYWPSPNRWEQNLTPPIKKERLFEGVENLAFEFYIAPDRKNEEIPEKDSKTQKEKKTTEKTKGIEPEPKGDWRKQAWLEEYNQLPVMVKMILTMPKGQDPIVFIYPLANTKNHVIYE